MAVDMFIKIAGIEGESRDSEHHKEIDVLAWSWGASRSDSTHAGGGGRGGKANVEDLTLTKYVDAASAPLLLHVFDGRHIDEATLAVRAPGGDGKPFEFLVIKLEDLVVTSIACGGSDGEDRLTENVTLNFSRVRYDYASEGKGGAKKTEEMAGWDIARNSTLV